MKTKNYIGVIGAGSCDESLRQLAYRIGYGIGNRGLILVCGGLGGVMEGSAHGCFDAGGMTIGILPGTERSSANPYIRISIPTGLGEGRNLLIIRASDILIAIGGEYGTLSEIGFALKMNKTVIGINTWKDIEAIIYADTADDVLTLMDQYLKRQKNII